MSILLDDITKRYEGQTVVNHVSLEIHNGEFFVLLGSSGSGKTTVLNAIAGLVGLDAGRIHLHGRDVTDLPTQQRRVGFVFQHYALFQHMTVAENIDFGPSVQKVNKAERRQRRDRLLELVGLTGLGNRLPGQLSGGQQQRVALARALALEPDVLLLDEPLGALDAKIRQDLRRTLRDIQQRLGIAAILVTHDQEEAFDLADRIGVMSYGRLLEVGTPQELYQSPKTEFVASFLGSANLLVGDNVNGGIKVGAQFFPLASGNVAAVGRRAQILFRPEDVAVAPTAALLDTPQLGVGEVEDISYRGSFERLRLRLPPSPGVRPIAPSVPYGADHILVDASRSPEEANRAALQVGDKVAVGIRRVHAIANPGIHALIVSDGSARSKAAITLGGHVARLAYARVTLLGYGSPPERQEARLQEGRKMLGNGLAAIELRASPADLSEAVRQSVERQPYELVVLGFDPREHLRDAEHILESGDHHLLLAPAALPSAPGKTLICVTSGEPSKDDVFFTGRLMRHLGAEVTLLNVIPSTAENPAERERAALRFLEQGERTLSLLGIQAQTKVRRGDVAQEILSEMNQGGHQLLVLGAPLARADGHISLSGVIGEVLNHVTDRPVLIIRSPYTTMRVNFNTARRKGLI